jgi:hypothetical protein
LLVIVVGLLLFAVVPGSAGAITNGQKDTENKYPFVGLLAFYDADGEYMHRCTDVAETHVVPAPYSGQTDCPRGSARRDA